jgi:cysteinyl-tRNA synthetase
LVEDVLIHALKLSGYRPFVARNIADVDDKTIRDSQKAGMKLSEFTEKYTGGHWDCQKLNIL